MSNKRYEVAEIVLAELWTLSKIVAYKTGTVAPKTYFNLKKALRKSRKTFHCTAGEEDAIDATEIALFKAIDALMAYETVLMYGNDQERLAYYGNEFAECFSSANNNLKRVRK